MEEAAETQTLRLAIERSLRGAFDPADVLPRLARLERLALRGSDDFIFANHKLAELLVERNPWRAALYVRRALAHRASDDRLWAILAFCQTLLGNYRAAIGAYRKAIACAPSNPWYAHNLGHLYDVALGQPDRALAWLESAHRAKKNNAEIVASYAHALARAGRIEQAKVIVKARRGSRELEALYAWLEQGAPKAQDRMAAHIYEKGARAANRATPRRLARVLARGLANLPLDQKQRQRALALARDAFPERAQAGVPAAELAAAVAYAIVYVDHVPLSQAEVAAPFRVGVAGLRGRFAELRAKLDIIRGDARYASNRR